jgi:hypothetical protein
MQKRVLIAILIGLLLLASCGNKTTGKRVAIPEMSGKNSPLTGAVTGVDSESEQAPTKTAAEALKEIKETGTTTPVSSGEKEGTFYPPITTDATGKEALKEKTRALFQKEVPTTNVQATEQFGPKYHSSDGDPTNLPDGYDDNSGD